MSGLSLGLPFGGPSYFKSEQRSEWIGQFGTHTVLVYEQLREEGLVEQPPRARWCREVGAVAIGGEVERPFQVALNRVELDLGNLQT